MSTLNIKTIRDSFELARPHAFGIVSRFYEILWEDFPELRSLFAKADMENQKNALVGSLAFIISHLDSPENLQKYLRSMGSRHVNYGVQDQHYAMIGQSLIKTFTEAFGDSWTPALAEQWTIAIGAIAQGMKEGAAALEARPLAGVEPLNGKESGKSSRTNDTFRIELPAEIRKEIRQHVRETLQEAIQQEVQACIEDELKALKQSKVLELLKKSA